MRQPLRSHPVSKLAATGAMLLVAGFLVAGPSSPDAAAAVGALTWSDDFNGAAGTAPDPAKWGRDTGGSGFGNNELQYYTTGTNNAALDGQGNLVLTARRENPANYQCWYGTCTYTSARLNTAGHFTQAYGRFEARLKVPKGQGLWPAFWMLGDNIGSVGWPNSGEIDVMENVGYEPNTVHGSLHGPGYSGGNPLTGTYSLPGGAAYGDGFHTFAVDWAPDSVTFYVDGQQYARHTPSEVGGNQWVFNHPFFIILNVAVGGNWPGSPNGSTVFPQQMVVDYVHVYAYTNGGGRTGQVTGFGGKCVDVNAASSANGTPIQLYTCNGTNAQQWTVNGSQLQALGKCLDVTAAGTANGTRIQLYDCNGTGAQQWTYTNGQLVNPASGRCLDATGPSSADRTPLQLWDCHGGDNQKWNLPTGSTPPSSPPPSSPPPAVGAQAAAPYLYLGWGSPPDPRTVMSATGVKWFTMAFMLTNGTCNPMWDGFRPLTGGQDQTNINNIRAAGGDVVISSGGASGPWLEQSCGSASDLAGAYQRIINAYGLKALDIDIEGSVYAQANLQQRTIDALKIVRSNNPGITLYVTFPSDRNGPDSSMINRAAQSGLTVDGWTIMPFDFGAAGQNMGALTVQAAEGLKNTVKNAYGYTDDQAYRHSGISSMNGITDVGETVTVGDFQTMLNYAQQHHLARLTFWSTNRDRPCTGGPADSCSGVGQNAWDYTRIIARYQG